MKEIVDAVKILFDELIQKSNQYKDVLMPGYTHLQEIGRASCRERV